MSATYTYPGVYIQELPSPVHTIAGVATSIAAFVGYTPRGIDGRAQTIFSFSDFERLYGGLASNSELSYAVAQFFLNGGTQAYIVRVGTHGATFSSVTFDGLTFEALSSGSWTDGQLLIDVDLQNVDLTTDPKAFNLMVTSLADSTSESFPNLTLDPSRMNYVSTVVNDPDNGSQLVNVSGTPAGYCDPERDRRHGDHDLRCQYDRRGRLQPSGGHRALRPEPDDLGAAAAGRLLAGRSDGVRVRRRDPAERGRPGGAAAADDQPGAVGAVPRKPARRRVGRRLGHAAR